MENPHATSPDRISNLPHEVVVSILNHLPIRDAARTSVLSSIWRDKWHHIPLLAFDDRFHDSMGRTTADHTIIATIDRIVSSLRSPILVFYLSLGGLMITSDINPVINKVLERGPVRGFTLYASKYWLHILPSELYLYPLLMQLDLRMCIFTPPPGFNGFPKLICLVMKNVQITSDVLAHLISNCPLLKQLSFASEEFLGSLAIVAPKLKYIFIKAPFSLVSLVDAPLLETVLLDRGLPAIARILLTGMLPDLIGFHSCLHAVQYLGLDYHYLEGLAARAFQTPFVGLEILKLIGISFGDNEVLATLSVIGNCPNLKKVSIKAFQIQRASRSHVLQFYEELAVRRSGFSFGKMREIEIHHLEGSVAEEGFIKFVLTRSLILEKMDLVLNSTPYAERAWMTLTEFFQIPSLSPSVRITLSTRSNWE